jgi:hypothetical protein
MKKLLTAVFAMLLAAGLTFAQTGGGSDTKAPTTKETTGKKGAKTSKAHKGGKKSKKGSGTSNPTPPPK